jgi:uncharacterized protein
MATNIPTVQQIYAAFGRGDVPSILERLAEDVAWEYGGDGHGVPWLLPGRGRPHAGRFFQTVVEELEITHFAVNAVLEGSGVVVALVDLQATVRRTGARLVEVDEAHLWHFDPAGRVVKFRHRVDTHLHVAGWGRKG